MSTPRATHQARAGIVRVFLVLILAAILSLHVSVPAYAAVKRAYAGIVVDAKTGRTLYSRGADAQRYPASVAKVMTLYIVFQELAAGRLKLSTRMKVSKYAASAQPTKLGLAVGSTIKVEDAIRALVTKSANDVARIVAEHISGTETAFAKRMTDTARAMGMSRTTYRNASGLPDSRQITTVRDQARLGVAIFQHFPQYYSYFKTRSFRYRGQVMGNHNRLLGSVRGVDGIKTGYTRASGFNLLTSARVNNRHIVVAAFGFDSSSARNSKVTQLIRSFMPKARKGSYWKQAQIPKPGSRGTRRYAAAVPVTPMPRLAGRLPAPLAPAPAVPAVLLASNGQPPKSGEGDIGAPLAVASLATPVPEPRLAVAAVNLMAGSNPPGLAPTPRERPIDVLGAWISETFQLGTLPARDTVALLPPVGVGAANPSSPAPAIDLMTSGSTPANAAPPIAPSAWIVQIGAAPSEANARALLASATTKIASLGDYRAYVQEFEKSGQLFFRARFTGFGDRAQARSMCNALKDEKMSCLAMPG